MSIPLFAKAKRFILENEYLRLSILVLLVFYSYNTFLIGVNLGAGDALWYQYNLHDALIQLRHGLFPTYLGQSIFNAFGGPVIRAPYYLFLGQFLDVITLGQLSSLSIQHLTVFCSAFAATFICYFLFVQIAPKLRWGAVAFTLFYLTCPGVIGVIYKLDMYYTFMTVPYVPIVIYGLLQSQQKNNLSSYIITAAALALIFMGHPAIGIWTAAICALCYGLQFIFLRKGFVGVLVFAAVFIVLTFWQFASTFSLGLGNAYTGQDTNYAIHVIATLNSDIPGVFFPLGLGKGTTTPYLQLGYSLWLTILAGIVIAFRYAKTSFAIQCLLACIACLLLLLYPIPFVTYSLWSLIPQTIKNITMNWPMQRFYLLLAVLGCFIGMLSLKAFYEHEHKKHSALIALLVLLCFWNLYQINYFTHVPFRIAVKGLKENSTYWTRPENINFYNTHTLHDNLFTGLYEPILKNRLLDQQQIPIPNYDNELFVVNDCEKNKISAPDKITPAKPHMFPLKITSAEHFPLLLFRANLSANKHYLLCLQTSFDHSWIRIIVDNRKMYVAPSIEKAQVKKHKKEHKKWKNTRQIYQWLTQPKSDEQKIYSAFFETARPLISTLKKNKPAITIPIYAPDARVNNLAIMFDGISSQSETEKAQFTINSYNLVNYDPNQLPIKIESFTPYKASVTTQTNNNFLELFKEYYPGYRAKVNDEIVPVSSSKNRMVMIPLHKAGLNKVELVYVGTPLMRISFYISTFAWIALFCYFCFIFFRKRKIT